MNVIRKEPGKAPEIVEIENELEALQKAVGGYIETFTFAVDACVICNEEGRMKGRPYNTTLGRTSFVGTILVVGIEGEAFTDVPQPEITMELLWPTARHKK